VPGSGDAGEDQRGAPLVFQLRFVEAVRRGSIAAPTRRQFKLQVWKTDAASLSEDESDRRLAISGEWIFERLSAIRSSLSFVNNSSIAIGAKLRALVCFANHNAVVLDKKVKQFSPEERLGNNSFVIDDVMSMKLKLPIGASFSPNEIIEMTVDGTEIPLRVVFQQGSPSSGAPDFKKINWLDVLVDPNLGGLYKFLEEIWDDCLWNDYFVDGSAIRCTAPDHVDWKIATMYRKGMLDFQFLAFATRHVSEMPVEAKRSFVGVKSVREIVRRGKYDHYVIGNEVEYEGKALDLAVAKMYAQEEYYFDLLDEEKENHPGVTIRRLFDCWHLISSAAEVSWNRLVDFMASVPEGEIAGNSSEASNYFSMFCPSLQVGALHSAVSRGLSIELGPARNLVSFLTYFGGSEQELWAQPLVRIAPDKVAPFFAALRSPNLRRICDVWMKQLGMDLALRGPAFEKFVQDQIARHLKESPILKDVTQVLEGKFTFRPKGARDEEIDAVAVIADLVILIEAKCILQPTEAQQFYRHRQTVLDAVEQVKRKTEAVVNNKEDFVIQLDKRGIKVSDNFTILPIVMLNSAIHAGCEKNGVAIVDLTLFRIFCEGRVPGLAVQQSGKTRVLEEFVYYASVSEAVQTAANYFSAPTHLKYLWESLKECKVPVPSAPNSELPGAYLWSREVAVDTAAIAERAKTFL